MVTCVQHTNGSLQTLLIHAMDDRLAAIYQEEGGPKIRLTRQLRAGSDSVFFADLSHQTEMIF
jgi:hypothetical protein